MVAQLFVEQPFNFAFPSTPYNQDGVDALLSQQSYKAISINSCAVNTRKNITTGYTVA